MNSKGNPRNEKVDIDLDEAYAKLSLPRNPHRSCGCVLPFRRIFYFRIFHFRRMFY